MHGGRGARNVLARFTRMIRLCAMARDEKLEHLRRVPLFARFTQRQLERLGQLADEVEVGLDEVLAEQGRVGHEFFVVLDGHVRVLDGTRQIAQIHPGDFFGEIALLIACPRTATVRALTPVRAWSLGGREFDDVLRHYLRMGDVFEVTGRGRLAALRRTNPAIAG